jgi:hypothetical protein
VVVIRLSVDEGWRRGRGRKWTTEQGRDGDGVRPYNTRRCFSLRLTELDLISHQVNHLTLIYADLLYISPQKITECHPRRDRTQRHRLLGKRPTNGPGRHGLVQVRLSKKKSISLVGHSKPAFELKVHDHQPNGITKCYLS